MTDHIATRSVSPSSVGAGLRTSTMRSARSGPGNLNFGSLPRTALASRYPPERMTGPGVLWPEAARHTPRLRSRPLGLTPAVGSGTDGVMAGADHRKADRRPSGPCPIGRGCRSYECARVGGVGAILDCASRSRVGAARPLAPLAPRGLRTGTRVGVPRVARCGTAGGRVGEPPFLCALYEMLALPPGPAYEQERLGARRLSGGYPRGIEGRGPPDSCVGTRR